MPMQDQIEVIRRARQREKRLLRWKDAGLNYQQIADKEGITRQRAHEIIRRAMGRRQA